MLTVDLSNIARMIRTWFMSGQYGAAGANLQPLVLLAGVS
jgi:hypothetical protein